ncbi:asparaginase [Acuticoccus sp. M5D2P5]|uniref:asparaginase n=1 Tax=Acuticoccus kalidii TaxID=2910977 RepID=UPI001F48FA2B|nr:asparaginase [Acuticoccus kalidii]MCF3933593.1 asparaginase [Acuticoccus kalidii]
MTRVAVIGTGGTISSIATDIFDYTDYPETGRKLSAAAMIEEMAVLSRYAELVPVPFVEVGSNAIGPADWLRLATLIAGLAEDPDIAGVVILHGTATLEETAYFLHLTIKTEMPVVLVGAQRPFNSVGTDAIANTAAGVRVAASPESRGRGVLLVLNDEIHSARDVTKTSTHRLHAFKSGVFGPLGTADPDRIAYARRPEREHTLATPFTVGEGTALPRVDIAYAYAGVDGTVVRAAMAAGAGGIVSAGFAPGMSSPAERDALLEAAASGVAVVQSTRVGTGRVTRHHYLAETGFIGADDLTPQKARILLMLGLMVTRDVETLREYFRRF